MRYVQSMYNRDWWVFYRRGTGIGASQTITIQVPLHTASMAPINSLSDIFRLDMFFFVQSSVPLRFSYGTVSSDIYERRGIVKLTIPGNTLPGAIVPLFGTIGSSRDYPLTVNVTNLSSSAGSFAIPHYAALVDYQSGGVPRGYYHSADPEQSGYTMPGDALWTTRFIYRGKRSAFPLLVFSQCVGQALARSKVSMILPSVRNYGQTNNGMEFIHLVWAINRLNRALGLDLVHGGV